MSSSATKLRRKMAKYQDKILRYYGIDLSPFPTKGLLICNGGLVNGVSREMVFEKFSRFGVIENIVMLPHKPHSFVVFEELHSAEAAYNCIHAKETWASNTSLIYLGFVEAIPETLNSKYNFSRKPPGLMVLENFITEEEESVFLKYISTESKQDVGIKIFDLKKRKVIHFGYEFNYDNNNVNINEPLKEIPKEFDFLWDRLSERSPELGLKFNFKPDQLTINNYKEGQGIPPHVDTHSAFEDPIISLSLQSAVVMDFRNVKEEYLNVLLPARSLCIMSGESRYDWTHGIGSRTSDIVPATGGGYTIVARKERTSFTFRKIRQKDCHCEFPDLCDTQQREKAMKPLSSTIEENMAGKLEEIYVHGVYTKISDHFNETRQKPWPNVLKFVQSLPMGSILVDVGCGNGKYFSKNRQNFEIGLDANFSLMNICKKRGFECFVSNCLHIPLKDNIADGCISIAVIHHLGTEERRKKAITEIIRILKTNGRALIYVWAKNQERDNQKSSYLKQNIEEDIEYSPENKKFVLSDVQDNLTLPVHTNRTNFMHNDLLVPWVSREQSPGDDLFNTKPIYLRYYHVFEDEELKNLCSNFNNIEIDDYFYDQGNWCIILRKK